MIETCLFVCSCGRLEKDFAENQNLKNKDTALGLEVGLETDPEYTLIFSFFTL